MSIENSLGKKKSTVEELLEGFGKWLQICFKNRELLIKINCKENLSAHNR